MHVADRRLFILSLLVSVDVLLLDQISKYAVIIHMARHPEIYVLPFFNLSLVLNSGISFGLFALEYVPMAWVALSLAIVAVLLVWLARNRGRFVAIGLGLVIGGAVSNVMDRFRFQAVVDFLDFHAGKWHWPAFNIADSAICIGVAVLALSSMLESSSLQSRA